MLTKTVEQLKYEAAKRWADNMHADKVRIYGPRAFRWDVKLPSHTGPAPSKPRLVCYKG